MKQQHMEKVLQHQQALDRECVLQQEAASKIDSLSEKQGRSVESEEDLHRQVETYAAEREARCKHFIEVLIQRRQSFLDKLLPNKDE